MMESPKLTLTPLQLEALKPLLKARQDGSHVLIASMHPAGGTTEGTIGTWTLDVRAIPASRREALRQAAMGTLTIPKTRKPKPAKATADA